jgi:hypothetical protein
VAQLRAKGGAHGARQIEIVVVNPTQTVKNAEVTGKKTSTAITPWRACQNRTTTPAAGQGEDRDRLAGQHQRHQPALKAR